MPRHQLGVGVRELSVGSGFATSQLWDLGTVPCSPVPHWGGSKAFNASLHISKPLPQTLSNIHPSTHQPGPPEPYALPLTKSYLQTQAIKQLMGPVIRLRRVIPKLLCTLKSPEEHLKLSTSRPNFRPVESGSGHGTRAPAHFKVPR